MNISRYALSILVAASLTGCSGSQPPIAAPGAIPQSHTIAARSIRQLTLDGPIVDPSWTLPEARASDLLYVTSYTGTFYWVYMFSYPAGKLVGKIAKEVSGLCSDTHGNVFMTQSFDSQSTIFEYAHGGKKPIAKLADPYNGADGCAVDPATGDLAVANSEGETVVVYSHARGKPKRYYIFFAPLYVAYTPKSRLFVLGDRGGLAELVHGQFKRIALSKHVQSPMGVQWDGKHLALGEGTNVYNDGLIREYTIAGRTGQWVSDTQLGTPAVRFFIKRSTVIASDGSDNVYFFSYPQGGTPTKTISGIPGSGSLTVSVAR